MEKWRKERDTLVAALEVQLQKLLSSQTEKDKLIQQLRQNNTQPPQEVSITKMIADTRTTHWQCYLSELAAFYIQETDQENVDLLQLQRDGWWGGKDEVEEEVYRWLFQRKK